MIYILLFILWVIPLLVYMWKIKQLREKFDRDFSQLLREYQKGDREKERQIRVEALEEAAKIVDSYIVCDMIADEIRSSS